VAQTPCRSRNSARTHFGVLVLSFAAATAGGITRDALIGAAPPAALGDWHYLAVSIFAGLQLFT